MKKILIILTVFVSFAFSTVVSVGSSCYEINEPYSTVYSDGVNVIEGGQYYGGTYSVKTIYSYAEWKSLRCSATGFCTGYNNGNIYFKEVYYYATPIECLHCEPIENNPSVGYVQIGPAKSVDSVTAWVSSFLEAHPDVTATETKTADTCGDTVFVNARYDDICSMGETLQPDGTTYGEVGLDHYSCSPDNSLPCENGYSKNDVGSCEPDIDCPSPMIYEVTDAWHGFWATDKRCVPDNNLTQAECLAIPGAIFGSISDDNENTSMNALMYGEGCTFENYSKDLFVNDSLHDIVSFMPFSPLWDSSKDLVVIGINKLFGSGKNLFNSIKDKFANSTQTPKPNLKTHEPEIIDMRIGDDGVAYEVVLNPKVPPKDNPSSWRETYDKFRDNGWDFPSTPGNYNPKINDIVPPTVNTPKFPNIPSVIDDFIYKGGDSATFNNSHIATANISKDGVVPNLSALESSAINKQVQTTIDLNTRLVGSEAKTYPTYLVKDSEVVLADKIQSTYKGYTSYPDGSKTSFEISRTKFNVDGRTVDNVKTITDIPTKNGTKVFNTTYQTFKDGTGAVTSTIHSPTSITTTTTSGTTTTTNNASNSVTTNTTQSAVDLTPVIAKLNSIDSKIQSIIDTPIPKEIAESLVRVQEFETAANVFDVDFNSYLDFVNGMKGNFDELGTLFDDSKAILENKPVINEINGQCGFNFNYHGTNIEVDPCAFVLPYRPLLALIFTLLGTFSVLGFTVKYLVARGD